MTKEQATILTHDLSKLLDNELIILAEAREWEHFIPKHVYLEKVEKVSSIQGEQNHVLCITCGAIGYSGLDNPVINFKTISFTVINGIGKKIYRSFTLAREWKDNQEMSCWIRLAHALI